MATCHFCDESVEGRSGLMYDDQGKVVHIKCNHETFKARFVSNLCLACLAGTCDRDHSGPWIPEVDW